MACIKKLAVLNSIVTPRPPKPHRHSIGASTRTHSTLLTLSSSLCVKELTRWCYGWWTKAYNLAPPLLNWQCGTKHAQLRSWATHGPSKLGRVWHSPPSKNPTSSSVQLTRPVPTHTSCGVPHPKPTRACICPHTDPTFPLSARPYVQCWSICHAVCPISGSHAPCALCMRNHKGKRVNPRVLWVVDKGL
jgi:hypothetical protein